MISIGPLTASSGEKISGDVPISAGHSNNTTFVSTSIPITIVNGMEDGPTLVVLSGIHGSEYIPIMTTQRLAKELDPLSLRGSAIFIHIANLPAYLGRTVYTSPADGKNLNRVFPGNSNGTLSERIAYFLVQEVYPVADYVFDMHSGDANEQLYPSYTAYYGKAGSQEVIQASKSMAMAFGLNLVVEFQWELSDNSTSNAILAGSAAVVRDIPSIDVEMAPGMGHTDPNSIDQAYHGVLRVMIHLGILSEANAIPKKLTKKENNIEEPCLVKDRHFIEAPVGGSWIPLVDTGTFVMRGNLLGYITDLYGRNQIYEVSAPEDGLLLIRFESPPVREGDTLAVVAALNTSVISCDRLKRNGPLNHHANDQANNLVLWQIVAAIGWVVALALGVFVKLVRRKSRRSFNHSPVSTDEVEVEGARVV